MEALRKLEPSERSLVMEIDVLTLDVIEELLDVERVPLRSIRDELDERCRQLGVFPEHLLEPSADQPLLPPPARARRA